MRLLLDTHVFLWWIADHAALSARARDLMRSGRNALFLSAVSGWEIAIKTRLGRLTLPAPPGRFVPAQLALNGIEEIPISMRHALHIHTLPAHHRDPFDRMLVAQAQIERMVLLTSDPLVVKYPVETIW